jgi:hypothetical protein
VDGRDLLPEPHLRLGEHLRGTVEQLEPRSRERLRDRGAHQPRAGAEVEHPL